MVGEHVAEQLDRFVAEAGNTGLLGLQSAAFSAQRISEVAVDGRPGYGCIAAEHVKVGVARHPRTDVEGIVKERGCRARHGVRVGQQQRCAQAGEQRRSAE